VQTILHAIQAQAAPEQVISARLLPQQAGAVEAAPLLDEAEEVAAAG
jgi:hypothetical protein